jgi:hypothetical protein
MYSQARPTIDNAAWTILGIYYAEEVPPRVRRHDYETVSLGTTLFMLLQFLAKGRSRKAMSELGVDIQNAAKQADVETGSSLGIQTWVEQYLE